MELIGTAQADGDVIRQLDDDEDDRNVSENTRRLEEEVEAHYPHSVRQEFAVWISAPERVNAFRPDGERQKRLLYWLQNPQAEATKDQSRDKYDARNKWMLLVNAPDLIYRQPEPKFPRPRLLVPREHVLDAIATEHVRLGHKGKNLLIKPLSEKYYAITREEILHVVDRCSKCGSKTRELMRKKEETKKKKKKRKRKRESDDDGAERRSMTTPTS